MVQFLRLRNVGGITGGGMPIGGIPGGRPRRIGGMPSPICGDAIPGAAGKPGGGIPRPIGGIPGGGLPIRGMPRPIGGKPGGLPRPTGGLQERDGGMGGTVHVVVMVPFGSWRISRSLLPPLTSVDGASSHRDRACDWDDLERREEADEAGGGFSCGRPSCARSAST